MNKTIEKILIFLLAGLFVFGATACVQPEAVPEVAESSSTSQSDVQMPAESEAPAEPVLLLGRNLATCGLGLDFSSSQLADPNRPELGTAQLSVATHWSPSEVASEYLLAEVKSPVVEGGATIAGIYAYDDFVTQEFMQYVRENQWALSSDEVVFLEHNGQFYEQARRHDLGLKYIVLQSFSKTDLAQLNAEIRVGNQCFNPKQLEENVVYENDGWKVFAFYEAEFLNCWEDWVEERENAEPYSNEWSYTDTEYDYSWVIPAIEHLQQNIGSYIFERNSTTENN